MPIQKYIDTEGNEKNGTQAIKIYFGSEGYEPVTMKELKPLVGTPHLAELSAGAAEALGWTPKED